MSAEKLSNYDIRSQLFIVPNQLPEGKLLDARDRFSKPEVLATPQTLEDHITHFDSNAENEGLPQDWWNLRGKVGFSMKTQMNLLQDISANSLSGFAQKNEQDLKHFCLEYLSKHLVYPFQYTLSPQTNEVIDPKYGKDMKDIVSNDERKGSVKRVVEAIRDDALSSITPDGTLYGYASPLGPTGLKTDDGRDITYPDSYWFFFQKQGDQLVGCTIKTDFSLDEVRKGVKALTGIHLAGDAPLEAYTLNSFRHTPQSEFGVRSISDLVGKLAQIDSQNIRRSTYAFENVTWLSVYQDIEKRDALYQFNTEAQKRMDELTVYTKSGDHAKLDLQKALAATFLWISRLFIEDQQAPQQNVMQTPTRRDVFVVSTRMSFGQILNEVEKIPGCAGGGKRGNSIFDTGRTILESLTPRLTETSKVPEETGVDGEEENFECPKCRTETSGPVGNSCPSCGYTQEQHIKDGGEKC